MHLTGNPVLQSVLWREISVGGYGMEIFVQNLSSCHTLHHSTIYISHMKPQMDTFFLS